MSTFFNIYNFSLVKNIKLKNRHALGFEIECFLKFIYKISNILYPKSKSKKLYAILIRRFNKKIKKMTDLLTFKI